jgi:hypothetical protein
VTCPAAAVLGPAAASLIKLLGAIGYAETRACFFRGTSLSRLMLHVAPFSFALSSLYFRVINK